MIDSQAFGSMESRVITQLAMIKEISGTAASDELPEMNPIETAIRILVKTSGPGGQIDHENIIDVL